MGREIAEIGHLILRAAGLGSVQISMKITETLTV
jgi:hypothetical protein